MRMLFYSGKLPHSDLCQNVLPRDKLVRNYFLETFNEVKNALALFMLAYVKLLLSTRRF